MRNNKVMLIGQISRDMKTFDRNGKEVAISSIIIFSKSKDEMGRSHSRAKSFILYFPDHIDSFLKVCQKGSIVKIEGILDFKNFNIKGEKTPTVVVTVDRVCSYGKSDYLINC